MRDFCWFNMLTPRAAEAREFFRAVLGWSYRGDIVMVEGCRIGGLFEDHRALIGAMLLVESADATAERVRGLGGRAQPAFDIGNDGRLTVCHDPTGAEFDAWQARSMRGTDADPHTLGAPARFELITTDVPGAVAFYSALFGWKADAREGSGSQWITHFLVADVAEAERRAIARGASVFAPGAIRSPQGVEFYVTH
jgi:uncharacterized protein